MEVEFGLLGRRLAHSFSRKHFTQKFADLGLAGYHYLNFELERIEQLPALLASRPRLRGFNVTIPYKRSVRDYLDSLDPEAAAIGAVNTVVPAGGGWRGYNTDIVGFAQTLDGLDLDAASAEPALVLGTGGASDAVGHVLRRREFAVQLVSRTEGERQITYAELDRTDWAAPRLIVNTTPVGTWPDTESAPAVPLDRLGPQHAVIDLIYNPPETYLLRAARLAGAQTANGATMLLGQAEAAWSLWQAAGSR